MAVLFFRKRSPEKGVCFFDIDGVLNTSADWSRQYTFRSELVANLCQFAKEENLDLVMISSWRIGFEAPLSQDNLPHIRALEREMDKHDVRIAGKTPVLKGKSRDQEIERYLYYHPYGQGGKEGHGGMRCIVIDDDTEEYSKEAQKSPSLSFFFTDSAKGFSREEQKRARKMLS